MQNPNGTSVMACVAYFMKYCVDMRITIVNRESPVFRVNSNARRPVARIVARPNKAEGNFAAKSVKPNIFMDSASIQTNSGGYSKFRYPLKRTFHQSAV